MFCSRLNCDDDLRAALLGVWSCTSSDAVDAHHGVLDDVGDGRLHDVRRGPAQVTVTVTTGKSTSGSWLMPMRV